MNTSKPQIHSAGSAVRSIQGSVGITDLNEKDSSHLDFSTNGSKATPNAYQADE